MVIPEIAVRDYCNDDWEQVCAVHDKARPMELDRIAPRSAVAPMHVAAHPEGFFDCRTFVASVRGTPLSIVAFASIRPPELTWLYVDPAHQRVGIGRRLVDHVLPMLVPDGYVLCTEESPSAVSFYRSCGFVLAARFPGEAHGYPCTCLRMCLPTSSHRDRPPNPSRLALELAGYPEQDRGRPARDPSGIWVWTRNE